MTKRKRTQTKGEATASPLAKQSSMSPQLRVTKPITFNQSKAFKAFGEGKNVIMSGYAGTGKSFIALYLGLREVIREGNHKHLTIIRSTVPSRDQGFLPGTPEEKAMVYETPYRAIVDDLFNWRGHYDQLKRTHQVEFESTSYLRGTTLRDRVLVVDEAQNMSFSEINTVMTRVGENTRIIVCGDYRQTDLKKKKNDVSGYQKLLERAEVMPSFHTIEMQACDIVRSGFVKEWILAGD